MRRFFFVFLAFFLLQGFQDGEILKKGDPANIRPLVKKPSVSVDGDFGNIPLYFIANEGQVHRAARFYARASGYTLWLTREGLVFDRLLRKEPKTQNRDSVFPSRTEGRRKEPAACNREVSRLVFERANRKLEMKAVQAAEFKVNYFIGNDQSKWRRNLQTSLAVLYQNIYPNIDLKVYGIENEIEYDWVVKPGGNPREICFTYLGIEDIRSDEEGNLAIKTDFGRMFHKRPVAYQKVNGLRINVDVAFKRIKENTFGFDVAEYDHSVDLVIDPVVLAYSTYLGGDNTDYGGAIAADDRGCVYVTGWIPSSDFPTLNPYQTYQGSWDIFVSKLDTTRSGTASLIYSTFIGGTNIDYGLGIAVDGSGQAYVAGRTYGTDFPTVNSYMSDPGDDDRDAIVFKLNTAGNDLLYSTYLGGNDSDSAEGIAVDDSGCAYITGSVDSTDFPCVNQYQTDQVDNDAFVSKLDTTQSGTASLVYSTYLGGGDYDYGEAIDVDSSGYVYVTGGTSSTDFPTLNQYQGDQGARDVFITKLDTTQSGTACLIYSTYLGGGSSDSGSGIAVDDTGNVCVTGQTYSTNFPTLNQYQADQGQSDVFVTRLDTTQSGAACLIYSTYLGGGDHDGGHGISLDGSGFVYVTGYTRSTDFPILNEYQTDQAGDDVFVTKLDTSQSGSASLVYSTYLGGSDTESGQGIAADSSGNAYVTGTTESTDFPTVNQFQTDQWTHDPFVSKLITQLLSPPTVTTMAVSQITAHTAMAGGTVTDDGGAEVTERGVCWGTYQTPTLNNSVVETAGSGLGSFSCELAGLNSGTGYYVRAFARNSAGVGYGQVVFFQVQVLGVTLQAVRKTEQAWIVQREYGDISAQVDNQNGVENLRFILYRKADDGNYAAINEINGSDLENGSYHYVDTFLEPDQSYTYYITVVDGSGLIISVSNEVKI